MVKKLFVATAVLAMFAAPAAAQTWTNGTGGAYSGITARGTLGTIRQFETTTKTDLDFGTLSYETTATVNPASLGAGQSAAKIKVRYNGATKVTVTTPTAISYNDGLTTHNINITSFTCYRGDDTFGNLTAFATTCAAGHTYSSVSGLETTSVVIGASINGTNIPNTLPAAVYEGTITVTLATPA